MARAKTQKAETANTAKVQRIRIRLKSYDHRLLDKSSDQIVDTAKRTGSSSIANSQTCLLCFAFTTCGQKIS
jgi:hypothetical protein